MNGNSRSDTIPLRDDLGGSSQPTFTLSQEMRAIFSQDMTETQKMVERLLRAGQYTLHDSSHSDYGIGVRNNQQDMYRPLSQEIPGSQQTFCLFLISMYSIVLSQGNSRSNSQEDSIRLDSLYQGFGQNLHQSPSQSTGGLFDPVQSQGWVWILKVIRRYIADLKLERSKTQSIDKKRDIKRPLDRVVRKETIQPKGNNRRRVILLSLVRIKL